MLQSITIRPLLFALILTAAQAANAAVEPARVELPKAGGSWELMDVDGGITVHRKQVPGSKVVAFRGESVVEAPIAKVANVLFDTSRKLEWVAKCAEARDLRWIGPLERIEYNATHSGFFLVKDREFVFRIKTLLNREKSQARFEMRSVEDDAGAPDAGRVRGFLDDSRYILTRMDDNRTHVVVEIHADPRGSVPKWLVNLFQKSWPTVTLSNIARQANRPDVPPHRAIEAFFNGATLEEALELSPMPGAVASSAERT